MKKRLLILFFFPASIAIGQVRSYPFYELYQLDSIGHSTSISRHFGSLYFDFLSLVEKKLMKADTATIKLVRHFEQVFARFYIDACEAYRRKEPIPHAGWATYFRDMTLLPSQYYLLGANAHLNGQLAEAILHSYTPEEWKMLKAHYVIFNRCLNKVYRKVYDATIMESQKARLLHLVFFGLDKPAGNYFLYKWRKRQMRLAQQLFDGSGKYDQLAKKVQRNKEALDRLVINKVTSFRQHSARTSPERVRQASVNKQTTAPGGGSYD